MVDTITQLIIVLFFLFQLQAKELDNDMMQKRLNDLVNEKAISSANYSLMKIDDTCLWHNELDLSFLK